MPCSGCLRPGRAALRPRSSTASPPVHRAAPAALAQAGARRPAGGRARPASCRARCTRATAGCRSAWTAAAAGAAAVAGAAAAVRQDPGHRLSIGSGGSGGIFGPGMVIGGMLGRGLLAAGPRRAARHAAARPAPFVIVGMMALFGGIAHAPLAVMLMVAEMTGNLSLLAPAMVAVAISTALVVGDTTIYRSQLPTRADSPRTGSPSGCRLVCRGTARGDGRARLVLAGDHPARQALAELRASGVAGAPVVNDDGAFLGPADRPGSLGGPRPPRYARQSPGHVEAMTVPSMPRSTPRSTPSRPVGAPGSRCSTGRCAWSAPASSTWSAGGARRCGR